MKKRISISVLILLVIAAIAFFGVRNRLQKGEDGGEVVRIGAILPLTGNLANLGQENKVGIELALEKVNREHKRIEIIYEDGKGDSKTSVSAMKKLEMQGINKVILSTTQTVMPILDMYKDGDFFFLADCQTKGILKGRNNAVRLYFSSENETTMMADYILMKKFLKVAVLRMNTESCQEPIETMKCKILGVNQTAEFFEQTFDFTERDFRAQFAAIKGYSPDVLVIYSYPDQWEQIVKQMVEQNINYPIVANSGFGQVVENEFYKNLSIMNNLVFPSPTFVIDNGNPEVKGVIDKLRQLHVNPNFNVLYLYDNIKVIAENLEYAGDNRLFLQAICSKKYEGITGNISFNSDHDIELSELIMVKFVDGSYHTVSLER